MYINVKNISTNELRKLLTGCLAKERFSQKKIYEIYAAPMMSLCLRFSKNREEAEEVLQDGFIQMYKYLHQFNNQGSFEGWLRRIMINCALQRYRSASAQFRMTQLSDEHFFMATSPDLADNLYEKELIRLIQSLPESYRMVFNLYVFEGMKHREIADLLNISEGTSKSNLFDARRILKNHLNATLKMAR